jgi:hypothetical protein
MLRQIENTVTITCDKCGTAKSSTQENYNNDFWNAGFVLNKGRKYEHLCSNCLPPKKQKALLFVKSKLSF